MTDKGVSIAPAEGKLGVLLVGLGAVSTTLVAGVEAIKRGISKPVGSLTQMGTIRLGKRTDNRSPKIKDFVPLADINDIVFGAWDIFHDSAYDAAMNAGVLDKDLLNQVSEPLASLKPMAAVFEQNYVKRITGENVKTGKNKMDLAEQLIADIAKFKSENNCVAPGNGLVRFDRDLHRGIGDPRVARSRLKKRCMTTTRSSLRR